MRFRIWFALKKTICISVYQKSLKQILEIGFLFLVLWIHKGYIVVKKLFWNFLLKLSGIVVYKKYYCFFKCKLSRIKSRKMAKTINTSTCQLLKDQFFLLFKYELKVFSLVFLDTLRSKDFLAFLTSLLQFSQSFYKSLYLDKKPFLK